MILFTIAGKESFAAATSYPLNFDTSPLNPPPSLSPSSSSEFNILHKFVSLSLLFSFLADHPSVWKWRLGNLSPWRSVSHGLGMSPSVPKGCEITQIRSSSLFLTLFRAKEKLMMRENVDLLHRHGARYPTLHAGPAEFGKKWSKKVQEGGVKACVVPTFFAPVPLVLLNFLDLLFDFRSGKLSFLNEWNYQLGAEILSPFGVRPPLHPSLPKLTWIE